MNIARMVIIGLLLSSITLNAQDIDSTSKNENQTTFAEITFETMMHDYGKIEYASDGISKFIFTNTGTVPLILNSVKSTCGCTIPKWPQQPINPGDTDTIKVSYNTRRSGVFNKGIIVYSNATNNTVRLMIKGEVEAPAELPVLGEIKK